MENDRNAPATKGDLDDVIAHLRSATKSDLDTAVTQLRSATKSDLDTAISQLRSATKADLDTAVTQLRSEMSHQYDDLKESIRDSETRLLQAFYGYAESNRKRMGHNEADTALLNTRVATLEDRLMEVEKRLNMPPAA